MSCKRATLAAGTRKRWCSSISPAVLQRCSQWCSRALFKNYREQNWVIRSCCFRVKTKLNSTTTSALTFWNLEFIVQSPQIKRILLSKKICLCKYVTKGRNNVPSFFLLKNRISISPGLRDHQREVSKHSWITRLPSPQEVVFLLIIKISKDRGGWKHTSRNCTLKKTGPAVALLTWWVDELSPGDAVNERRLCELRCSVPFCFGTGTKGTVGIKN